LLRTLAEWLGVDEWLSNGQSGLGEHPGEPVLLLADCATFAGIPFGALPDARGRALASRATLIYAPDVWSFSQLPASQPAAANTLGRVFLVAPQHFGGRHAPLPATRHEIDLVQRLWPDATCLVGGDATCSALRALAATGALQSFDVLIFATHACYFPDHPRLTGLALADGEISVDELSRWQLDARLAFVGACESSRATAVGGENRLGIERALLHAGVHAVVSAAWEVDDALASAFAASLLLAYHAVGETTHSFQRALRAHMTSASIAQWAAWRLTTSRP
jgi:CHAT domain-containing protein